MTLLPVTEFEPADLVVDTGHLRVVLQELQHLGLRPAEVESAAELGLTLLTGLTGLTGLASSAARVRGERAGQIQALQDRFGTPVFTDLDAVLLELRHRFASHCGGWTPTVGKHRHLGMPVAVDGGTAVQLALADGCSAGRGCVVADAHTLTLPRHAGAAARPTGTAGTGVTVGILDAPAYRHERLDGHVVDGRSLLDPATHGDVWLPWEGHGMFVADLVLQQAPGAKLDMRDVFRGDGGRASAWQVARRMAGFARSSIALLNLSLGCRTVDGEPPLVLARAVERLGPDIMVVAAAGNHGDTRLAGAPFYPAALPGVIAVGATREPGSEFSPNLPWITCTAGGTGVTAAFLDACVTLPNHLPAEVSQAELEGRLADGGGRLAAHAAPNGPQPGCVQFHGYATWSGTSFAAATVSGAVAAATQPGRSAWEALDVLLCGPEGRVRRFEYDIAALKRVFGQASGVGAVGPEPAHP